MIGDCEAQARAEREHGSAKHQGRSAALITRSASAIARSLKPRIFQSMDNFTLFVIVADVLMCLAFIALMVFDKPQKPAAVDPLKPGRKSA
jgi:hypothetical protein